MFKQAGADWTLQGLTTNPGVQHQKEATKLTSGISITRFISCNQLLPVLKTSTIICSEAEMKRYKAPAGEQGWQK